jgi:hypothetical protein
MAPPFGGRARGGRGDVLDVYEAFLPASRQQRREFLAQYPLQLHRERWAGVQQAPQLTLPVGDETLFRRTVASSTGRDHLGPADVDRRGQMGEAGAVIGRSAAPRVQPAGAAEGRGEWPGWMG